VTFKTAETGIKEYEGGEEAAEKAHMT